MCTERANEQEQRGVRAMRSDRDRDHARAVGREEEGWRVMARVGTDGATQKHTRWAAGYIKRAGARAEGGGRRAAMHLRNC